MSQRSRSRSRSPSPPKIKEGKQEKQEAFNLHSLPKDMIMEVYNKMENKSPYLATAKSTRRIIEPLGGLEGFFNLPKNLQNKILDQTSYQDVENLLLTPSKILQSALKRGRPTRMVSKVVLFNHLKSSVKRSIDGMKFQEAVDQIKNFILQYYLTIISEERFKMKIYRFINQVNNVLGFRNLGLEGLYRWSDKHFNVEYVNHLITDENMSEYRKAFRLIDYLRHNILDLDALGSETISHLISILSNYVSDQNDDDRKFLIQVLEQLL